MKVLIPLLAFFGAIYAQIEPLDTDICRLFANGVKLRQPGTCGAYITCQNGESKVTSCNGQFYNKNTGKCAKSTSDDYCKDPCTKKTKEKWITDPKSCTGYFKCVDGEGTQGHCPSDLHFYQEQQACIYKEDSPCKGYEYCGVVPDNVPFNNEADCQEYFTCEDGKLKVKYCENGYYHAQRGCIKKSEIECLVHPIPINICGTTKKPIREKFVNDKRTCRGYYYCKDKGDNVPDPEPNWGQCPEGRFFEIGIQGCYPAAAVDCEEDRCDGRQRSKVISGTKGCQHYLVCDGDETVREEKCPDGLYFNDDIMECTTNLVKYIACS